MKRSDLEKLAKDMEEIGYEILAVKPLQLSFDSSPRKILNGTYNVKIAPIQACDDSRTDS
jgi:hypothetical protein